MDTRNATVERTGLRGAGQNAERPEPALYSQASNARTSLERLASSLDRLEHLNGRLGGPPPSLQGLDKTSPPKASDNVDGILHDVREGACHLADRFEDLVNRLEARA
jgi:hypothetical protein